MVGRILAVGGEEWTYKVGQRFVEIRSPEGTKFLPTIIEIIGPLTEEEEIEEAFFDNRLYEVRPRQVHDHIVEFIGPIRHTART